MAPVFETELLTPSYNTTGGTNPRALILRDGFTQSHGDLTAQDPFSIRFTGAGVISGHTYSVAVKFDTRQIGTGPETIGTATGTFSGGSPQTVAITSLSEPTAAHTDSGYFRSYHNYSNLGGGQYQPNYIWKVESTITTPVDGLSTTNTNFDNTEFSTADTNDPPTVPPWAYLVELPNIAVTSGTNIDLVAGTVTNGGSSSDRTITWDIDWGTRLDEEGTTLQGSSTFGVNDDGTALIDYGFDYSTRSLSFRTTVTDSNGNDVTQGGTTHFTWGFENAGGNQGGMAYDGSLSAGATVTWKLEMVTSDTATSSGINNNCSVIVYEKTLTVSP